MPGPSQSVFKWIFTGVAVAAIGICVSCSNEEELSVEASFAIEQGDLVINYSANQRLIGYSVFDGTGSLLTQGNIGGSREGELRILQTIRSSAESIRFKAQTGENLDLAIPELIDKAVIRTPFEPLDTTDQPILLTSGSYSELAIDLGELADSASEVQINASEPLYLVNKDGPSSTLRLPIAEGQRAIGGIRVGVRSDAERATLQIQASFFSAENHIISTISREVAITELSDLRSAIRILKTEFPASVDESTFGGRREGYLDLDAGEKNYGALANEFPATYQRITISNTLPAPTSVLISAEVLSEQGHHVSDFDVPPGQPGPNVTSAAIVPASGHVSVALPFFVNSDKAVPGTYQRLISVKLAGTGVVLTELTVPFEAGRSVDLAWLVTGVLTVMTLFIFSWLFIRRSHVLDRFTTKQIVLAGLFAAASVVIVNVPVYFLTSITVFLLGPMGFLIDGLLSEFVFFALLTILVSIMPVRGMCATVIATRFLLGGVLLGMVTPVGMLHAVATGVTLEAAVYLSGLARWANNDSSTAGVPIRLTIYFAVANTVVSWVGFQLAIVLFRLHYADWYVFLSVAVGGFVYAFLGSLAGRTIGRQFAEATP